ncbi:MAG: hypothetical protein ACOZQL_08465 [Myxococcota bacterium]
MRASLLVMLCASLPALAEDGVSTAAPAQERAAFEVSLKGGVHLPQIANALQTSFDFTLKLGYALPLLERRLQLYADVGYTQPSTTRTGADERLPGGTFSSLIVTRDLATALGLAFFMLDPAGAFVPWISAAVRIHFLRVETVGTAGDGSQLGTFTETDTRVGGVFGLGAGYRLGPGRVLAEVDVNVLPVDQRLTGDSNASSLSVLVGYGVFF